MNLLQTQIKCVECGSTKLIKDFKKNEIYCSKCGLVLLDSTLPTLKQLESHTDDFESESDYKKTRRIQFLRLSYYLGSFIKSF